MHESLVLEQEHSNIRECVAEARKVIAPYWPIRSFIATNALSGLEHMPFTDAQRYAQRLFGSHGYLPLAVYRHLFEIGRITPTDLADAISRTVHTLRLAQSITIAGSNITVPQLYNLWVRDEVRAEAVQKAHPQLWQAVANRIKQAADAPSDVDPLLHVTNMLAERIVTRTGQVGTAVINNSMTTWCAAFLNDDHAGWPMPGREQGFFRCWKALAAFDTTLKRYSRVPLSSRLQTIADDAETALTEFLQQLEIPKPHWSAYIARHIAALPGWASAIRWCEEHPAESHYPITLTEYLAVRLFYETILVDEESRTPHRTQPILPPTTHETDMTVVIAQIVMVIEHFSITLDDLTDTDFAVLLRLARDCDSFQQQAVWQDAYEWHYRHDLIRQLRHARTQLPAPQPVATAQALFCIDVRSEGMRRHLEEVGNVETFGVAGFFGILMQYQPFGSECRLNLAPALVSPTQVVREVPQQSVAGQTLRRYTQLSQWRTSLRSIVHGLRENLVTPFAFIEMAGVLSALPLIGKTLTPRLWSRARSDMRTTYVPTIATEPSFLRAIETDEMSIESQAQAVAALLRSIGLTVNFTRLVLLCGHGSQTENNPYAAALDCGACGGNPGGSNAATAVAILNSPVVRARLAQIGIAIPADTVFIAAEHNTTADTFRFFDVNLLPPSHHADFQRLERALVEAADRNAQERGQHLTDIPGDSPRLAEVRTRAMDWAQIRPEWGLVRNAAFLCGRRTLTAHLPLDNRVFLHSYDPDQDPNGTILEGILTAPVIVAEWINMQYYMSSVDNQRFGSGTKLLHTVVSGLGVMQGQRSDLLLGLPQQSVMVGNTLYHEPLRLCVIVETSPKLVTAIVAKHEGLRHLVHNDWIALLICEPATGTFYRYTSDGQWQEVGDAEIGRRVETDAVL